MLEISPRLRPVTRKKELFATIMPSVARFPIALGNPNLSRTLHADIIDSYIGFRREKIVSQSASLQIPIAGPGLKPELSRLLLELPKTNGARSGSAGVGPTLSWGDWPRLSPTVFLIRSIRFDGGGTVSSGRICRNSTG